MHQPKREDQSLLFHWKRRFVNRRSFKLGEYRRVWKALEWL